MKFIKNIKIIIKKHAENKALQEKNDQLNKRIKEFEEKNKNLKNQAEKDNKQNLRNQKSQLNEKNKELEDKNKGKIIRFIFFIKNR
jgi:hypothetical protein